MLTIRASVKIDGKRFEIMPEGNAAGTLQTQLVRESPAEGFINATAYLTNGAARSGRVTELYGLDITVPLDAAEPLCFGSITGDSCSEGSFRPADCLIRPGETLVREPQGARSSNITAFPYFDLAWAGQSMVCGIGWSGQWRLTVSRDENGFRVTAGQADCDMVLQAGEKIRSVRILLLSGEGDVQTMRHRFVRLHRKYYSPAVIHGETAPSPVTVQCFDRYFWGAEAQPGKAPYFETEAAQVRLCEIAGKCGGFDTHWVDACWFKDTFRTGVGNYSAYSDGFPNGLKAVSEAAHRSGMRFLVWFEPVRAVPGTEVWERFAHDNTKLIRLAQLPYALVNLGDPEVWDWVYTHIVTCMEQNGIDAYREDFNIDPLDFLRSIETPDRVGMAQMRFTEGIYRLWDALRAHFPGLLIDNCSSGGRLLDVETCSRAYSLWQSDTGCMPDVLSVPDDPRAVPSALWHQNENLGLSRYLPYHQTSSFETDAYHMRSAMTGGISCEFDFLAPGFDTGDAHRALAEVRRLARYWDGDFTPLTASTTDPSCWCAYTLRLPKTDEGMVMAFRRENAPESCRFALQQPDPARDYRLTFIDEDRMETSAVMTGAQLRAGFTVTAGKAPGSVVVLYAPERAE